MRSSHTLKLLYAQETSLGGTSAAIKYTESAELVSVIRILELTNLKSRKVQVIVLNYSEFKFTDGKATWNLYQLRSS